MSHFRTSNISEKMYLILNFCRCSTYYLETSTLQSRYSRDYFDAQKAFSRSHHASDADDNARSSAAALSAPLSVLLIPSLKDVSTARLMFILSFLSFLFHYHHWKLSSS